MTSEGNFSLFGFITTATTIIIIIITIVFVTLKRIPNTIFFLCVSPNRKIIQGG